MASKQKSGKATIGHASFWYVDGEGRQRVALRGEEVDLSEADYTRGVKHDAFVTEGQELQASPVTPDVGSTAAATADGSDTDDSGDKEPTIGEILESVGADKEAASAALEAENAKDKPRSTLVTKLEAVINAGD